VVIEQSDAFNNLSFAFEVTTLDNAANEMKQIVAVPHSHYVRGRHSLSTHALDRDLVPLQRARYFQGLDVPCEKPVVLLLAYRKELCGDGGARGCLQRNVGRHQNEERLPFASDAASSGVALNAVTQLNQPILEAFDGE
jgi:hypothetical protein